MDVRTDTEVVKGSEGIVLDHKGSETTSLSSDNERRIPTDEELDTLPKVSGPMPWNAFTVGIVEFAERFSYYGTTAVFVNFIQRPLPAGSTAGNIDMSIYPYPNPGALGMGQRASTGLTQFNNFWSYFTPLLGAYLADQYWGRYLTIQYSICFALVGHVILIVSALPSVIATPNGSIAAFAVGIIIMGLGTGGFKSNVSALIAEQYKETAPYVSTDKKGNKVIVDPAVTVSRIYIYFYFLINCGSLTGSIAMVYAERLVGFWLSFLLPTIIFIICPMVLFACKKQYTHSPPTGSVMAKAWKLLRLAFKGRGSFNPVSWKRNLADPAFWERVKPSNIPVEERPAWMTFDDAWVDEVRRGILACKVFLWYPLYWLAYNQMTGNLTSQAGTLVLNGVPNDIIGKLNPITIIILIPIMDHLLYPALRKAGINFSPIKKITFGFFLASAAMIAACVTQYFIYKLGPCGDKMNNCKLGSAPITVWVQIVPYALIGMSEVMASITKLEYAFTKAPKNMRSTVQALALLTSAISSALGQALTALSEDPLLVWNYGVVAVLAAIGGVGFYYTFRQADKDEDRLNLLPNSTFIGREVHDEEAPVAVVPGPVDVKTDPFVVDEKKVVA